MSHVVMKKSLAKALMDAGMEHFDGGGAVGVGPTSGVGIGGAISGVLGGQNEYQATAPKITTQNFSPGLSTAEGLTRDVYGQQKNLAQALLQRTQGQGPNPAQAALAKATGDNIASTASLMAGARGGNANPGLIAELAARRGATTQQQAAGQGAALQAEQEIAAQKELQSLYGNQAQSALQEQSILQGANAAQNSALTTGELGAEQVNAQIAGDNSKGGGGVIGGILSGIGSVLGLAEGGEVPAFADGGIATYATPTDPRIVLSGGGGDGGGSAFKAAGDIASELMKGKGSFSDETIPGVSLNVDTSLPVANSIPGVMGAIPSIPELMPTGGGAGLIAPSLPGLAHGGPVDFRSGGPVPGKAQVKGDSSKNDTVPALLSPGEEVLPRSVTMAKDAPQRAKAFVEALRDQKGEGKGYGKVLKAKATLKERVDRLEKLCGGGRV